MKIKRNISIDKDLMQQVIVMAKEEGRSVSNMIEFLIRKAIESNR